MAQFMFGTGRLTQMPVGGGAPLQFAALQNLTVDFTGETKELWGRLQYPLDTARGKVKVSGKAAAANIDINLYNAIYFGHGIAIGQTLVAEQEFHQLPPFSVTVPNTPFLYDMGVVYAATGADLVQVPSAPLTGQYSVSLAGVYTFSNADTGLAVLITYAYDGGATGAEINIGNQLMGTVPTFQLVANGAYKGNQIVLTLFSCVSGKLTFPLKLDDYMIPEFDFAAYDNGAGAIAVLTSNNA